jgi:hypothetical protein
LDPFDRRLGCHERTTLDSARTASTRIFVDPERVRVWFFQMELELWEAWSLHLT